MAVNLKELAQRLAKDGYPVGAKLLRDSASSWEKVGIIPKRLRETSQEGSLETIIAKQVDRLIELGFHQELGKSAEEYRADFVLPEGASQPESYVGRFDVALVVEPRITLTRKHELARLIKEAGLESLGSAWRTSQVSEWIKTEKIRDLTEHPTDRPYLIFTHDGIKYRLNSAQEALTLFADDEVGSPQLEVTDLFLQIPEYFEYRGVDAAGSRYRADLVPSLGTYHGEPRVDARGIAHRHRYWGALSRGKEIIRLGV